MKNALEDIIDNGIPVIDNTKDAAYYRDERLKRDEEKLAKHVFVENVELGTCSIDPETHAIRKKVSLDFVYFQQESGLFEWGDKQEELLKKCLAEQLLQAVTGIQSKP